MTRCRSKTAIQNSAATVPTKWQNGCSSIILPSFSHNPKDGSPRRAAESRNAVGGATLINERLGKSLGGVLQPLTESPVAVGLRLGSTCGLVADCCRMVKFWEKMIQFSVVMK
jgi:hypothetical protein